MPKNKRLIAAVTGAPEAWQAFVASLSRSELGDARNEIEVILADFRKLLETIEWNRDDLQYRIEQQDKLTEKAKREERRTASGASLRQYLKCNSSHLI